MFFVHYQVERYHMESLINNTNQVWQRTIDTLQHELDQARDMPAWAIAVVVLCFVGTLCMFLVCGIWCGILLQQSSSSAVRRVEYEMLKRPQLGSSTRSEGVSKRYFNGSFYSELVFQIE